MRYYKSGLTEYDEGLATQGYTLLSPINQRKTYLIDMHGAAVHEWDNPLPPGNYAYLLANGNLLRAGRTDEGPKGNS